MIPPAQDAAVCRAAIKTGSRSFYVASHLLPRRVREPAFALYAFCRLADDLVDDGDAAEALTVLCRRLDAIYQNSPEPYAADRALSAVIRRYRIPREIFDSMLEGFAWDAENRRYSDLDAVRGYAVRVAGTVGLMMCLLMGVRRPRALARACDLGIAMQLTNIARDVGEDARAGRVYLPQQWMDQAGVDVDRWLHDPRHSSSLTWVVRRLLMHTDAHYAQALRGVAELPRDCRSGIGAAGLIYADIGRAVVANGWDSVTRRAVVDGRRKLRLVARACARRRWGSSAPAIATHPAAQRLIDAVVAAGAPAEAIIQEQGRLFWVLDLFERLGERERALQAAYARRAY